MPETSVAATGRSISVVGGFRNSATNLALNIGDTWSAEASDSVMIGGCVACSDNTWKFMFTPTRKWQYSTEERMHANDIHIFTIYVLDSWKCIAVGDSNPFHVTPIWTAERDKESERRTKARRKRREIDKVIRGGETFLDGAADISEQGLLDTNSAMAAASQTPSQSSLIQGMQSNPAGIRYLTSGNQGGQPLPIFTQTLPSSSSSSSSARMHSTITSTTTVGAQQAATQPSLVLPGYYPSFVVGMPGYPYFHMTHPFPAPQPYQAPSSSSLPRVPSVAQLLPNYSTIYGPGRQEGARSSGPGPQVRSSSRQSKETGNESAKKHQKMKPE